MISSEISNRICNSIRRFSLKYLTKVDALSNYCFYFAVYIFACILLFQLIPVDSIRRQSIFQELKIEEVSSNGEGIEWVMRRTPHKSRFKDLYLVGTSGTSTVSVENPLPRKQI